MDWEKMFKSIAYTCKRCKKLSADFPFKIKICRECVNKYGYEAKNCIMIIKCPFCSCNNVLDEDRRDMLKKCDDCGAKLCKIDSNIVAVSKGYKNRGRLLDFKD